MGTCFEWFASGADGGLRWNSAGPQVRTLVDKALEKVRMRQIAPGHEQDAFALCEGIIFDLYRVRKSEAFDIWSRGARKLPAGYLKRVPEWRQPFRRSVTQG